MEPQRLNSAYCFLPCLFRIHVSECARCMAVSFAPPFAAYLFLSVFQTLLPKHTICLNYLLISISPEPNWALSSVLHSENYSVSHTAVISSSWKCGYSVFSKYKGSEWRSKSHFLWSYLVFLLYSSHFKLCFSSFKQFLRENTLYVTALIYNMVSRCLKPRETDDQLLIPYVLFEFACKGQTLALTWNPAALTFWGFQVLPCMTHNVLTFVFTAGNTHQEARVPLGSLVCFADSCLIKTDVTSVSCHVNTLKTARLR